MKKCCESLANVGSWSSSCGADRAAVAVDRVVAAPQDPVVGGQPVVVKLVAQVADVPGARASRLVALRGIERLGDEHVVVDRRDVAPDRAHERRVGAGREQHAARVDDAALGDHRDAGRVLAELPDRAVLVDAHAGSHRRRAQAVGELAGVHERGPGPRPQRRRRYIGEFTSRPDLLGVEQLRVVPEPPRKLGLLVEVGELARLERDDQIAGRLELRVDPEALEVRAPARRSSRARAARAARSRPGSAPCRCRSRASARTARSRRCARSRRRRTGSPRARTTSRAGSSCLGVERRPQPGDSRRRRCTGRRRAAPSSGACASRSGSVSSQNDLRRWRRRRRPCGQASGECRATAKASRDPSRVSGDVPARVGSRRRRGEARAARPRRGRGRRSRPRGRPRGCPRRCRSRTSRSCRSRA